MVASGEEGESSILVVVPLDIIWVYIDLGDGIFLHERIWVRCNLCTEKVANIVADPVIASQ